MARTLTNQEKRFLGYRLDRELVIHIAILIAVAWVPTLTWFRGDFLLIYNDHVFIPDITRAFSRLFFSWDDAGLGFSNPRILAGPIPFDALKLIGEWIGISVSESQQVWLFLFHTLAGLSMYYLVKSVWPERSYRLAALFAACFYVTNPMRSDILFWPITAIYASFPLKLALFIKGVRESRGLRYAIGMILLWMLTSNNEYTNPVFAAVEWAPLLLYLIWYLSLNRNASRRRQALRFTIALAGVWVALNIYWLLPVATSAREQIAMASLSPRGFSEAEVFRQNALSTLNGLRLLSADLQSDFMGDPLRPWGLLYGGTGLLLIGFLIPFLAFVAVLRHRKDSNVMYFALLGVMGLLLVMGPYSPFGGLIEWLWLNTPIGTFFRFPLNKFGPYVLMAYSVLIGITLLEGYSLALRIADKVTKPFNLMLREVHLSRMQIVAGFILLIGYFCWPYWLGDIVRLDNGPFVAAGRVEIPDYYYNAARWFRSLEQDFRLGIFPTGVGDYSFLRWRYGLTGINPGLWLFNQSLYSQRMEGYTDLVEPGIAPWFDLDGPLRLLNIRYLMFQNDVKQELAKGHPWIDYLSPTQFKELMRNQEDVPFEKEFGELDFYGINDPLPHIYPAPEAVVVSGDLATMSSLAVSNYLEGYPLVAFTSQQRGNGGTTLQALVDKAQVFLSTNVAGETDSLPDLVRQDSEYHIAYLVSPEAMTDSQKPLYVPNEASYLIQAHVTPRVYQSNINLLPERTDWEAEFEDSNWQITGSESIAAGQWPMGVQKPLIFYGDGWYGEEQDHQGIFRWGNNNLALLVLNPNPQTLRGTLSFRISTIYARDLDVAVNGQFVESIYLNANYDKTPRLPLVDYLRERIYSKSIYPFPYEARFPAEWNKVILEDISLKPGGNQIIIHTAQGTDVMNDLLGNGDAREVSTQIWDGVAFEVQGLGSELQVRMGESGQRKMDTKSTQYEINFVNRHLELSLHLDEDADEQEFVLMHRDMGSIDLEQYPIFNFHYWVSDPAIATVDAVFGIDYTDDGQADGYVIAQPSETDDDKGWQVNLNIFEEAKVRFSDQYYREGSDIKLVTLYLVSHKKWELDEKNTGRGGLLTFQFGDLNLYNEQSISVPSNKVLKFQEEWANWMVEVEDTSSKTSTIKDIQRKLPYPAKVIKDEEQFAEISTLFDLPLIELNGQAVTFQPPNDQANLLDWKGYWLEPETVSLAAGKHELEVLSHSTFQVDLVEVANKPYEPKEPNAEVTFRKINPTRYNVEVDAWDDFWLVFSESFHPDWKAYIVENRSTVDRTWYEWSALLTWFAERGQRSELTDHYQVNAYANGWFVPKIGKYTITLEFTPQRLYEIGVIISSITFIASFAYLVGGWIRRRNN